MAGYFALLLHGHLPFVRHPEHPRFLEENWLFEAISETYLPLLQLSQNWRREQLDCRLTLTLSPTLCAMLQDSLLQTRCVQYLENAVALAEKEAVRTHWEKPLNELAEFYLDRFTQTAQFYAALNRDLVSAFRRWQDSGQLEIITTAATHALLPLLQSHPPSLRAQVFAARDDYEACFGRAPRGIWLPECAYASAIEPILREANLRWFVLEAHGLLNGEPRPRFGTAAPVFTPEGLAVFGRDVESAKQVWSRQDGYPGDPIYRDFYRDIGFDLDLEYLRPHLPAYPQRSFTGLKYCRISGRAERKEIYQCAPAVQQARRHAAQFWRARLEKFRQLETILGRDPILVAPYDAELFGHWWFEGPEFLDALIRQAQAEPASARLITPSEFLELHPTQQLVKPSPSSWGEEGYWKIWLDETNEWIWRHLTVAQEKMTELACAWPAPSPLTERALRQAGRELLLAQSSDWPFILHAGTSPEYAAKRAKDHLLRFLSLHDGIQHRSIDESRLIQLENADSIFPRLNFRYWQ